MSARRPIQLQTSRELRRRVLLRARVRSGSAWSDASILNVSSRGLLINSATAIRPPSAGTIEIRHANHVIVAEIVWSSGTRLGLRTENRVPVDEILAIGNAAAHQVTAKQWPHAERRKLSRGHDDSRLRGRAFEFIGIAIVAASLGILVASLVQQVLGLPMAAVDRGFATQ